MRGICDIRSRLIASAPIGSDGEELDEFHRIATSGNDGFPDYKAPIVRNGTEGRELATAGGECHRRQRQ